MQISQILAAANNSEDGNAFVGMLVIIGIIWFVVWLFSSKPKSYEFNSRTTGSLRPR